MPQAGCLNDYTYPTFSKKEEPSFQRHGSPSFQMDELWVHMYLDHAVIPLFARSISFTCSIVIPSPSAIIALSIPNFSHRNTLAVSLTRCKIEEKPYPQVRLSIFLSAVLS